MVSTILKPYEARTDFGPIRRFLAVASLILLAMFYGVISAIFPLHMLAIPAFPFLIATGLILWMLPDVGGISYDSMQWPFLVFMALNLAWPSYVAFNLPGFPMITPTRLFLAFAVITFVLNFSSSGEMRAAVLQPFSQVPHYLNIFWALWAVLIFSIVFSDQVSVSLKRIASNFVLWLIMMFLVALLATRKNFVNKIYKIILYSTVVVVIYSIYEVYINRVFWLDYLPPFLSIDVELLNTLNSAQSRAGTTMYRVRGPFGTALYFSEFLTMMFPFFVHFLATEKKVIRLIPVAAALVGLLFLMHMTNARSAMVGMVVVAGLYPFFRITQRVLHHKQSIIVSAILAGYPAIMGVLSAVIWFWPRAHVAVLGGGATAASSSARDEQWRMAWPKVMSHPFGHGVGNGNSHLGFLNAGGHGSVDSYFITILLDAGYLGLPLFLAAFLYPAWLAFNTFRDAETPEEQLLAPLSLALINFALVKSVLSSENTIPLAFIFVGCIVGLIWQHQRRAVPKTAVAPSAAISVPSRSVVQMSGKVVPVAGGN